MPVCSTSPPATRTRSRSSVPSDGGVGALRTVLDRLATAHLEVDDLSIHTPDLDDVFFALTGKKDASGSDDTKGTES